MIDIIARTFLRVILVFRTSIKQIEKSLAMLQNDLLFCLILVLVVAFIVSCGFSDF